MKKRTYTLTLKAIALLLVLTSLISVTAFAAVPETVGPLANNYIIQKTAYLSPVGSGRVQIHFDVKASSTMDTLGVKIIDMYESSDQTTWHKVKNYQGDIYVAMLDENTSRATGYVTFFGMAPRYYKAYVCYYAEKNGTSESAYGWTTVVRAT